MVDLVVIVEQNPGWEYDIFSCDTGIKMRGDYRRLRSPLLPRSKLIEYETISTNKSETASLSRK